MKVYERPQFNYTAFNNDEDFVNYHVHTREVPAVELLMPEEELLKLVELDRSGDEILQRFGPNAMQYVSEAQSVLGEAGRERRIRNKNPAVQLAWEKYQMLLKIAGE
jgi:hypothetical protein